MNDVAVIAFAVGYTALWAVVRHRAMKHLKPGASAWTRLGVGWSTFRPDNFTEAGQRAQRILVAVHVAALPSFLLIVWLLS